MILSYDYTLSLHFPHSIINLCPIIKLNLRQQEMKFQFVFIDNFDDRPESMQTIKTKEHLYADTRERQRESDWKRDSCRRLSSN